MIFEPIYVNNTNHIGMKKMAKSTTTRASRTTTKKSTTQRKSDIGKKIADDRQSALFAKINDKNNPDTAKEISQTIKAMLELSNIDTLKWRGLMATPPASYLENILQCFHSQTNIPLEMPFFAGIHCLSAYLLKTGCYINLNGQKVKPDLWTVVLSQSGSGKTYATNAVTEMLGVEGNFNNPASSAKFVEELSKKNNGFWIRDEFLELIKSIESQPQLSELKDYLLRLHDGKKIERITKKEEIIVHEPSLVIFGTTVLETFIAGMSPENLVDGFAQRFNYVIARKDDNRKMEDYALYDLSPYRDTIKRSWDDMINNITHKEYILSENAEDGFRSAFKLLIKSDMPESFYRRIMFRSIRYALIYHIILGKSNNIIDAADMGWAARLCTMHLKDVGELIEGHDKNELQQQIYLCAKAVERLKEKGQEVSARNIIHSVHRIKTASQALAILRILGIDTTKKVA